MKKNRILRIGLLALALTLVTASLVSGTFAKYVTKASGTGTVNVAKWFATVTDKAGNTTGADEVADKTVEFNLFKTIDNVNGEVVADHVAPGTSGSFTLDYDTTGTEVAHTVTIKLKMTAGTIPANMVFTIDDATGFTSPPTTLDFNETAEAVFTKTFTAGAGGEGNLDISWLWPTGTGTNDARDQQDTLDGETLHDNPITFTASFEAIQNDTAVVATP